MTWCGLGKQNRPTYNALSGLQNTQLDFLAGFFEEMLV